MTQVPDDAAPSTVFRPDPRVDLDDLVAFLNTQDPRTGRDRLADASRSSRWLRAHHLLMPEESLPELDVPRLRRFREVVRSLVAATHTGWLDDAGLDAVQRACARIRYRIGFGADGAPRLEAVAKGADAVMGRLLLVVLQARATGSWSRVKTCRNPACRKLFIDTSRNRSRSWCAMTRCGNQAKARTFRRRRSTARGGPSPQ